MAERSTSRLTTRAAAAALAAIALAVAGRAGAAVEIAGIDGVLAENLLAHLRLDDEPCDSPQWRVEQQYRAAPAQIREALQAYGYYEPMIEGAMSRDDACWHVTFTLAAGPPVLLRRVALTLAGEAANDAEFIRARDESGLASGAVLEHGAYDRLKLRWGDLARERGYAEAKFVASRIDVYPEERVADVELTLDSGTRYSFGRVGFKQDVLTERLASSYVTFSEGEAYDARRLADVYGELAASGFFRTIDVRALAPDTATRTIPVEIALTSAARIHQSYGIGFSTDTGPRFRFGRNNHRYNERGHQFGVNVQLSPVISEVTANYRLPLRDSRSQWLNFDTGLEREKTDTAESERVELGARRVIERRQDWTRTDMLSLRVEDFAVADQEGRARLLLPGVDWTRIRADNEIRPLRGSRVSIELRAASDAMLSDTSFLQAIARGKWIWSTPKGRRFLVRGDVGVTAKRDFDELPASVRFFAGGDNSVRGYEFEALGPVDADGEVIGGSALATGSFEFEQRVAARWSMAFFVDSGNAFEGARIDAHTGAGLGARWQSPLGPIRFDIAHPFDDDTTDWRVHVSLGPDL
jgi:translocation and assembly module TamA